MKTILLSFFITLAIHCNAQECEYDVSDTVNSKTTKEYLISEKVFGGASNYIFFTLSATGEIPALNFQLLSKSKDFSKAYCLDSASKIYFQLTNGKIITLINALGEHCSNLMYDSNEKNNIRILTSTFYFTQGSLEELEKSSISIMKVRYTTETVDYTIRKEIKSELNSKTYYPEAYFIKFLKCIK